MSGDHDYGGWYIKKSEGGKKIGHFLLHGWEDIFYKYCGRGEVVSRDGDNILPRDWKRVKPSETELCQKCLLRLKRKEKKEEEARERHRQSEQARKRKLKQQKAAKTGKVSAVRIVTMAVEDYEHVCRVNGYPANKDEQETASSMEGINPVIEEILDELQVNGVWPGTKLRITVEEV